MLSRRSNRRDGRSLGSKALHVSLHRRPFERIRLAEPKEIKGSGNVKGRDPVLVRRMVEGTIKAGLPLAFALSVAMPSLAVEPFVQNLLTMEERNNVELFRQNTPSVVYVTNLAPQRDAFTLNILEVPQGTGSGIIWDGDGHIVTNFHVIRGANVLRVTFQDQSVYDAAVIGYDEDKDVAVLKVNAPLEKLKPVHIGTSQGLLVGQKVYAIGNPFGLDHTLTTGVISGLGREINSGNTGRPIEDVIQTDAAINPGNSGGPLLNSRGNVVGINTAIFSPSGASNGVGFAIPVDTVSGVVDQIIKFGKVTRPILGISFAPESAAEALGVKGVLVLDAPKNGPAGSAGMRSTTRDEYGRLVLGDIITALDGTTIQTSSDLYKVLDRSSVGQSVDVEVLRQDSKEHLNIVLAESLR